MAARPRAPAGVGSALPDFGIVHQQDSGPDLCIARYGSITVPASGTEAKITGSRVLVLVGDTSVDITGVLDVSADGSTPGAGAGTFLSGGAALTTGGGGAGGSAIGGAGGSSSGLGGATNGGAVFAPSPLVTIRGGASAATNASVALHGEAGGGGGGALVAIACRGGVTVSGLIDAGGGGGHRGDTVTNYGAGGGSGGYVALQGLRVDVSGKLYANGGWGGDGKASNGSTFSVNGFDAYRAAAYGTIPRISHDGGLGGRGAVAGLPMADPGQGGTGRAAGGGGAMGALQVFVPTDVTPSVNATEASPGFSPTRAAGIR